MEEKVQYLLRRKIGKSVLIEIYFDSTNEIFALSIALIFFVNFSAIPHRNGTKIQRIANLIPIDTERMFNPYIFSKHGDKIELNPRH